MSRRLALAAAVAATVLALGGCAGIPAEGPEGSAAFPAPRYAADVAVQSGPQWSEPLVVKTAAGIGAADGWQPTGVFVEGNPYRAYRLDSGDRLRIFVYGQPNLSRLYPVDQSGRISVPLVGSVMVRGSTTVQIERALRQRLGEKYVRDPQVTVDVQQYRPFYILGEVRNPGQYPYAHGMTIETAVAIAGGYGERASERRMRLKRRVGSAIDTLEVEPNFEVEPGDSIYVKERLF